MKKLICLLLCLLLLPLISAAEEDELLIEDVVEDVELDDSNDTDTPAGSPEWTFPVALKDLDPGMIRIANKHYLLDSKFVPEPLVTVKARKTGKKGTSGHVYKASGASMQLQQTCLEALTAMCEAAEADGFKLYLKSAYRSYKTQKTMYYNRLKKNNGKDDGWVAMPGSSDHQTGLGCDVVPRSWRDKPMNGKMGAEPECRWMAEHCSEFGFILRYPEDKENETEINYEPWHMRYVGIPAAVYIMENGLCLEEFNDQLQEAIRGYLDAGGDPDAVSALIQTPEA